MRLAHLILVHSRPSQLERLIKRLAHPSSDIFIQLDAKTDMSGFEYLRQLENVRFIRQRVKISWGTYSVVQATLNGMEEILSNSREYSHINLLSGQDYLLKSSEQIVKFFSAHQGKNFMMSVSLEMEIPAALERVHKYNLDDYRFPGKFKLREWINRITPDRKPPAGLEICGLSQWMSITPESAAYVINYLKNNPKALRYFRMTGGPDEFIFQSILNSSAHKNSLVNDNLRYIRFRPDGVRPVILSLLDAEELLPSDKLFARKFDEEIDKGILDHLDAMAVLAYQPRLQDAHKQLSDR